MPFTRKVSGAGPPLAAPRRKAAACISLGVRLHGLIATRQLQPVGLRRVRPLPPVPPRPLQVGPVRRAPRGGLRVDAPARPFSGLVAALGGAQRRAAGPKNARIGPPPIPGPPARRAARPRAPRVAAAGAFLLACARPFTISLKDLSALAAGVDVVVAPLPGAIKVTFMRVTPITAIRARKGRGGRRARAPGARARADAHKGNAGPGARVPLQGPCGRVVAALMAGAPAVGPAVLSGALGAPAVIRAAAC